MNVMTAVPMLRRAHWLPACLCAFALLLPGWSRAGTLNAQSLDAGWQFRLAPGDKHAVDHPRAAQWLPATVPGTVQTDLLAAKLVPDPYWRDDEAKIQWAGLADWQYRSTFTVDAATLARRHVELVFDGLDTFADISLNGHGLLAADNMFRRWRVPAKAWLHAGANTLEVTRNVEAAMAARKPALAGVEVDTTIFRPATYIERALHNLTHALLFGCVLVIVVLVLFLFDWRAALISTTAIPHPPLHRPVAGDTAPERKA